MKDQHLRTVDDVIAEIAGMSIEELANEPTEDGRHLITVDELRAAGALDVPTAWRKSLGGEKSLFDESDDEASAPNKRDQDRVDSKPDEQPD